MVLQQWHILSNVYQNSFNLKKKKEAIGIGLVLGWKGDDGLA
jgi:hypothetical protein